MDRPPKRRDPLSILIGDALRTVRKNRGLTQEEAAVQLDVTGSAVSHYESGQSQSHLRQFIELCAVLDADPADILTAVLQDGPHT